MKITKASFMGFRRADGQVGVRNQLGIISTVTCVNQASHEIARFVEGASVFSHQQGCGLTQADLSMVEKTLINLGRHPNLGAVLVVSLGCEGIKADRVAQEIAQTGKPVDMVRIQSEGGYFGALKTAGLKAQSLARAISDTKSESVPIGELRLGIKCGASDPTSGIASNPAVGKAVDLLIGAGGSAVFGETTELIGAEHILARRCSNKEVAAKLLSLVENLEMQLRQCGTDIQGGNPSAGNIASGLTTLEEKSLGAIVKAGSTKIVDVLQYGDCPPSTSGLFFVDSPGREPEILAALAAAGCQVILFSTGIGAPHGFPFVPVIKISGNRDTVVELEDVIDMDVSQIIMDSETCNDAGERILAEALRVCSGRRTKAETIGYCGSTALYQKGPIV